MGYQAKLELENSHGTKWVGVHQPGFVDLQPLLRQLIDLDLESFEDGFSAVQLWGQVLPPSVRFIRLLGPCAAHLMILDAPLIKDVVIKLVRPKQHGLRWLTGALQRSRAHRAYLWAHRLRALSIETPRPLGFLEQKKAPAKQPSFACFEYVEAPTLIEVRDRHFGDPRKKRAVVRQVAELVRSMHARNVFHADLHAENLLIDAQRVVVVDLESMRTFRVAHRAVMKNLVRLNRDFLDTRLVTRTDRMRFLSTYLKHHADRSGQSRFWWSEVRQATQTKLQERGEAFR